MHALHRIRVFTDRYPWLGPLLYVLSIEFFITQLVVANAWNPPYSWRLDTISDLGRVGCGLQNGRYACSPLHVLMNASLLLIGFIMLSGSLLIYQEFRENKATLVGFTLMAIAGFGTLFVGLFPEDLNGQLHAFGASMPFLLGNLSLLILGISLYRIPLLLRVYTVMSGIIAFTGLYFFLIRHYGSLGIGGVERIVAYPQVFWLSIFGLYTSKSHNEYLKLLRKTIMNHTKS